MLKYVLIGTAVLVAVVGTDFAGEYYGLVKFGFFAPRIEQVRRSTFEQSRAYNEGMAQELQQLRRDYASAADPIIKSALADTIRHRVAGLNPDSMNDPSLASFVRSMQQ